MLAGNFGFPFAFSFCFWRYAGVPGFWPSFRAGHRDAIRVFSFGGPSRQRKETVKSAVNDGDDDECLEDFVELAHQQPCDAMDWSSSPLADSIAEHRLSIFSLASSPSPPSIPGVPDTPDELFGPTDPRGPAGPREPRGPGIVLAIPAIPCGPRGPATKQRKVASPTATTDRRRATHATALFAQRVGVLAFILRHYTASWRFG